MAISTTSFAKTPQASDDAYAFSETELQNSTNANILVLDVMANDLGGNAKALYSVDDGGASLTEIFQGLVQSDVGKAVGGTTQKGALLKIVDGRVQLDLTPAFSANTTYKSLDQMGAGDKFVDTFTYAIRLGNGTLSWATVTYTITGTNDAPKVEAALTGSATEDAAVSTVSALAGASDVDVGNTLSLVNVPATADLPAGVSYDAVAKSFTLDPSVQAYQSLAAGAKATVVVNYGISDGTATTAQSITWTVTGTNDAPVFGGTKNGQVSEDGVLTASGILTISDPDAGQSQFKTPSSLGGTYGEFSFNSTSGAWAYSLNNSAAIVQSLAAGQSVVDKLTVVSSDNSTQDILVQVQGASDFAAKNDLVFVSNSTTGIKIPVAALLGNDVDVSGAVFTVGKISDASGNIAASSPLSNFASTTASDGTISVGFDYAKDTMTSGYFTYTLTSGGISKTGVVEVRPVDTTNQVDKVTLEDLAGTPGIPYAASYIDLAKQNDIAISLGSVGMDIFLGGDGMDALTGGAGSDRLVGGAGNDTLTGGAGSDIFVFDTVLKDAGTDSIVDFNATNTSPEHDFIELATAVFAGIQTAADPAGTLLASQFQSVVDISAGGYTNLQAKIVYDQATGNLYYDGNGAVGGVTGLSPFATLVNKPVDLDASDFKLV